MTANLLIEIKTANLFIQQANKYAPLKELSIILPTDAITKSTDAVD